MERRVLTLLLLPFWALASHGCQWLGDVERARKVDLAQADHAACTKRGYTWPGEAYDECRRQRADARQREQWSELQMARQQQQRHEIGVEPDSPIEPYRPIREENFRCVQKTATDGESYIACAEHDLSEAH